MNIQGSLTFMHFVTQRPPSGSAFPHGPTSGVTIHSLSQ
jgi:hypothetical protein